VLLSGTPASSLDVPEPAPALLPLAVPDEPDPLALPVDVPAVAPLVPVPPAEVPVPPELVPVPLPDEPVVDVPEDDEGLLLLHATAKRPTKAPNPNVFRTFIFSPSMYKENPEKLCAKTTLGGA